MCVYPTEHVWRSQNNLPKWVLSHYHVIPKFQIQVVEVGGKDLYPSGRLIGPQTCFLKAEERPSPHLCKPLLYQFFVWGPSVDLVQELTCDSCHRKAHGNCFINSPPASEGEELRVPGPSGSRSIMGLVGFHSPDRAEGHV